MLAVRSTTFRLIGCGLICLSVAPAAAAQGRDVFVSVIGQSGMPVVGLTASDFAVREDGRDRDVVSVTPAAGDMHVALLVDTSSAIGSAIEPLRAALAAFVAIIAPGNTVGLYEFGANAIPLVPFTRDIDRLRDGVARLSGRPDSIPRLIDAVEMANRDLKAQRALRPVIVAVSVGLTDSSARTAGGVIKQLIEHPAALHVIAVSAARGGPAAPSLATASGRDVPSRRDRMMQMEAEGEGDRERHQLMTVGTSKTGGALHRVASLLAVGTGLDKVGAELASGYRLTFARGRSGRPRDLQVGVFMDDVTVRATAAPVLPNPK